MILCEVDVFTQEPFLEEDANASYELSTLPSTWENDCFSIEWGGDW